MQTNVSWKPVVLLWLLLTGAATGSDGSPAVDPRAWTELDIVPMPKEFREEYLRIMRQIHDRLLRRKGSAFHYFYQWIRFGGWESGPETGSQVYAPGCKGRTGPQGA